MLLQDHPLRFPCPSFALFVLLVSSVTLMQFVPPGNASCQRGADVLCCNGSNSECYELHMLQGHPQRCYCDESCIQRRNCCWDYPIACMSDCVTSEWSRWGQCSNECGSGWQKRRRTVLKPRRAHGKACPLLEEGRRCSRYMCEERNRAANITLRRNIIGQETANLLPMEQDVQRLLSGYDARHDKLRRHLVVRQQASSPPLPLRRRTGGSPTSPSHHSSGSRSDGTLPGVDNLHQPYCSMFELSDVSYFCTARMLQRHYRNSGGTPAGLQPSWLQRLSSLKNGSRMCVTCFEYYMRPSLGEMRCAGGGLLREATRWRFTPLPLCTGYFKLLGTSKKCTCPASMPLAFLFQ